MRGWNFQFTDDLGICLWPILAIELQAGAHRGEMKMSFSKSKLFVIGLVVTLLLGVALVASGTLNVSASVSTSTPVQESNPNLSNGGRGSDPSMTGWSTVDFGCGTWQYSSRPFGVNKIPFAPIVIDPQATPAVPQVSCAQQVTIQTANSLMTAWKYVCVFCVIPAAGDFPGDHNPSHFELVINGKVMHVKITWDRTPCMLTGGQQSFCMNPLGTPIGREYPLPTTPTPKSP